MRPRTGPCDRPGSTRVRCGRGFRCRDQTAAPLQDPEHLARIRALVIPPAWRDVWICLAGRGPSRSRVTARAVCLLDLGFFRIGSDRHTRRSETYGLTTMLREHVTCGRAEIAFTRSAVPPGGGDRLLLYWNRHATVLAAVAPVLTRLGERGDFGRPATQGAVEAAALGLLQR